MRRVLPDVARLATKEPSLQAPSGQGSILNPALTAPVPGFGFQRSGTGKRPWGRLWPHGEFSLTWRDEAVEIAPPSPWNFSPLDSERQSVVAAIISEDIEPSFGPENSSGSTLPPCLDSAPKSSQAPSNRPPTYGRKGISSEGAKKVRAGAHLLQRDFGKENLSFLTLTVPPLPDESAVRLAQKWGEVTRQLMQWLGRHLAVSGLPRLIVGVTEFQPRRASLGRLESLHLHLVFVGRKRKSRWAVSPLEVHEWWLSCLSRLSQSPVTTTKRPDMKMVREDASSYLGKYMSKGSKGGEELAAIWGWECIPRQWWFSSKPVKEMVRKATSVGFAVGSYLEGVIDTYFAGDDPKFPGWMQAIHLMFADSSGVLRPVLMGYAGRFGPRVREDVYEIVRALPAHGWDDLGVLKSA